MEAVLDSQMQLQELFMKRMDAFQAQLQVSSPPVDEEKSSIVKDFTEFRVFMLAAIQSLQDQIYLLAKETDAQEMRARLKILLFHGVAEVKDQDPVVTAVDTITKCLKITDFSAEDISRCHRMGRFTSADKPRPILIKFKKLSTKHKLWLAKTALKGSGITVSEFLTKPRHDAFMVARQRFGINKCWTRDGFVFLLAPDGKRHRITSCAELDKVEETSAPTASKVAPSKTKKTAAVSKAKDPKDKRRAIIK